MSDLISKSALNEAMYHEAFETDSDMQKWDSGCWIRYKMFENALASAPTIEPKHGEWIYTEVRDYPVGYNLVKCSCCGWGYNSRPGEKWILTAEDVAKDFSYCPNCGAKMD